MSRLDCFALCDARKHLRARWRGTIIRLSGALSGVPRRWHAGPVGPDDSSDSMVPMLCARSDTDGRCVDRALAFFASRLITRVPQVGYFVTLSPVGTVELLRDFAVTARPIIEAVPMAPEVTKVSLPRKREEKSVAPVLYGCAGRNVRREKALQWVGGFARVPFT
eukprot:1178414-Prorocentrum_minimum.AAC.2